MRRPLLPGPLSRPGRWLVLATALCAASCGGGLHPVRGKVLSNGQPAKGAVVVFHPAADDSLTAVRPSGVAGEDGTFSLSTTKPGDGVAPGEYIVTIVWPEEAQPGKSTLGTEQPPAPPDRLQGRYADRTSSTFKVTVKSGTNLLPPFEVQ